MKNIKLIFLITVLALTLFFNVERLDVFQRPDVQFSKFVYPLGICFIFLQILVSQIRAFSTYAPLTLCAIVYILCKLIFNDSSLTSHDIQGLVMFVEFLMLLALVYIAGVYAAAGDEFEANVEKLVFAGENPNIKPFQDAQRELTLEIDRSRRYKHPFSIIMVEPEMASYQQAAELAKAEIQQAITQKYLFNKLGKTIEETSRGSDFVISYEEKGRFIIICPDTTSQPVENLVTRLHNEADKQLGLKIISGKASFPSESVTLDELLTKAESSLEYYPESVENKEKPSISI